MKKKLLNGKNLFIGLLFISNVLALIYFLYIGYYNCPDLDDISFSGQIRESGFFRSVAVWYNNWQGRFLPHLIINTFMLLYAYSFSLLPYTLTLILLFVYSLNRLIKIFFEIPLFLRINISIFILSVIIFSAFEFNTFFWLTASTMYYGGPVMLTLGISAVLFKKSSISNYIILILSFLYVGCSSEHFALLVLLVFLLWMGYKTISKRFSFRFMFNDIIFQRLTMAFVLTLISFIIMIAAPGNKVRAGLIDHPDFGSHLSIFITSFKTTVFYTVVKFPAYLISFIVLYRAGSLTENKTQLFHFSWFKILIILILCSMIIILYNTALFVYITSYMPGLRTLIYFTFILIILISVLAYNAGIIQKSINKHQKSFVIPVSALMIYIAFIVYLSIMEFPLVRSYAESYNKRTEILKHFNSLNHKDTLYIEKLASLRYMTLTDRIILFGNYTNTMSYSSETPVKDAEISEDYDWTNDHLRFGFGLKYPVKLLLNRTYNNFQTDSLFGNSKKIFENKSLALFHNSKQFLLLHDTNCIKHGKSYLIMKVQYYGVNPLLNPVVNELFYKIDHIKNQLSDKKLQGKKLFIIHKPVFSIKYAGIGFTYGKNAQVDIIWEGSINPY